MPTLVLSVVAMSPGATHATGKLPFNSLSLIIPSHDLYHEFLDRFNKVHLLWTSSVLARAMRAV